ncbi:MAG: hypothetical protein ABSG25_06110 [Bryobacteraceae bacterium]
MKFVVATYKGLACLFHGELKPVQAYGRDGRERRRNEGAHLFLAPRCRHVAPKPLIRRGVHGLLKDP